MFGTERSHGPLADRHTLRLIQRGGEFGSSPMGTVQATACGALFDPGHNLRGYTLWDARGTSRGSARHVMLFPENLIRALLIFSELRSRHCQRALLEYHYHRRWTCPAKDTAEKAPGAVAHR